MPKSNTPTRDKVFAVEAADAADRADRAADHAADLARLREGGDADAWRVQRERDAAWTLLLDLTAQAAKAHGDHGDAAATLDRCLPDKGTPITVESVKAQAKRGAIRKAAKAAASAKREARALRSGAAESLDAATAQAPDAVDAIARAVTESESPDRIPDPTVKRGDPLTPDCRRDLRALERTKGIAKCVAAFAGALANPTAPLDEITGVHYDTALKRVQAGAAKCEADPLAKAAVRRFVARHGRTRLANMPADHLAFDAAPGSATAVVLGLHRDAESLAALMKRDPTPADARRLADEADLHRPDPAWAAARRRAWGVDPVARALALHRWHRAGLPADDPRRVSVGHLAGPVTPGPITPTPPKRARRFYTPPPPPPFPGRWIARDPILPPDPADCDWASAIRRQRERAAAKRRRAARKAAATRRAKRRA